MIDRRAADHAPTRPQRGSDHDLTSPHRAAHHGPALQHRASAARAPADEPALLTWFAAARAARALPTAPFWLHPGVEIPDPERFYARLAGSIAACPRAGQPWWLVMRDLRALRRHCRQPNAAAPRPNAPRAF